MIDSDSHELFGEQIIVSPATARCQQADLPDGMDCWTLKKKTLCCVGSAQPFESLLFG